MKIIKLKNWIEKYFPSSEHLMAVVKTEADQLISQERLNKFEQDEFFRRAGKKMFMNQKEYDKEREFYQSYKGGLIGNQNELLKTIKIKKYDDVLNTSIIHLYDNQYLMGLPELN